MSKAGLIFADVFGNLTLPRHQVPFNPKWLSGVIGNDLNDAYFTNAIIGDHSISILSGQYLRCISPAPDNRKMIFVGTRLGAVVVCERFSNNGENIVANCGDTLLRTNLIKIEKLGGRDADLILGDPLDPNNPNIGVWLEQLAEILK